MRYALTYEALRVRNPRLIYAQISGYGLEGAEAERRAFDVTGWYARTGILDVMHDKGVPPAPGAGGVGDHATAMTLFGAVMLALYRRDRTGRGGMVSTSLAVNGSWANGLQVQGMLAGLDVTERRDAEGYVNPFSNIYTTSDGRHLMLALAAPAQEFARLATALGHREWIDDARFARMRDALKNRHALRALLAAEFAKLSIEAADALLKAADVTFSVVSRLAEVVDDPQLIANGLIVSTDDARPGYDRALATPFRVHDEPQRVPSRAPTLGEHSRELLIEIGFDDVAIEALRSQGVIA